MFYTIAVVIIVMLMLALFFKSYVASSEEKVPQDYVEAITLLADKQGNRRFLNGSNAQAELVAGLMVSRNSEHHEVLIYTESLEPAFYKEILQNSRGRFRVIFCNTKALGVIRALPKDVQDRIDYRVSNTPWSERFLVVGNAFRYQLAEISHLLFGKIIQYEPGTRRSSNELFVVCNFNEPETAQKLRDNFEILWANSVPRSAI